MIIGIIIVVVAVLFCFLLSVANFSGERFIERYEEMDKVRVRASLTPLNFVAYLNNKHFDGKIKVAKEEKRGFDAYAGGIIFLSNDTLNTASLASFSIIAHELGHAKQDIEGPKLKKFNRLRRAGRIIGFFMMPLIIAGGVIMIANSNLFYLGVGLCGAGAMIFLIALFIKFKTISIEKEASSYAIEFLSELLEDDQVSQCKKFLKDTRMTYWADFLRTLFSWTFLTRKSKLFN